MPALVMPYYPNGNIVQYLEKKEKILHGEILNLVPSLRVIKEAFFFLMDFTRDRFKAWQEESSIFIILTPR